MTREYLILHGWQNHRPAGHWQRWLAESLASRGHLVRYPQLPEPDEPHLADWVSAIGENLAEMSADQRTVICHSLSCVAWRHLALASSAPVQRLLFVAPPSPDFLAAEARLRSFLDMPDAGYSMSTHSPPRLVCSDNDPYCGPGDYLEYADAFEVDAISGEGHFDIAAGYGEWPSILDWCEDPGIRITARRKVGH